MGISNNSPVSGSLVDTVVKLLSKAGYEVVLPKNVDNYCCGMIWESKGMPDIADRKTLELEDALLAASENGTYPVICDQSPCLYRMQRTMKRVQPIELIEFIHDHVADKLEFEQTDEPVAVHITC